MQTLNLGIPRELKNEIDIDLLTTSPWGEYQQFANLLYPRMRVSREQINLTAPFHVHALPPSNSKSELCMLEKALILNV